MLLKKLNKLIKNFYVCLFVSYSSFIIFLINKYLVILNKIVVNIKITTVIKRNKDSIEMFRCKFKIKAKGILNIHNRNVEIQEAASPICFSSKLILQALQCLFSEIKPLKTLPLKQFGQTLNER